MYNLALSLLAPCKVNSLNTGIIFQKINGSDLPDLFDMTRFSRAFIDQGSKASMALPPHIVAVPFLLKGHELPMLHLCRYLASSDGGKCRVTLLEIPEIEAAAAAPAAADGVVRWDNGVKIQQLSLSSFIYNTREGDFFAANQLKRFADLFEHFQELGDEVATLLSTGDTVTYLITDVLVGWGKYVADKLGVPWFSLWTSTCSELLAYYHIPKLISEGVITSTTSDTEVISIAGLPPLTISDYGNFKPIQDTDHFLRKIMLSTFIRFAQNICKADLLLVNSSMEIEGKVINELNKIAKVRPVGPLHILPNSEGSERDESSKIEVMKWLDKQESASVLYIAFGTTMPVPAGQLEELAIGLEASNVKFVWALRSRSSSISPLLQEKEGRGMIVEWVPQQQLLCHPSVGGFITHCGWNSVLESISAGVTMIARPLISDQQLTRKLMVDEWRIALGLRMNDKGVATRCELEKAIRRVMMEDDEEMREMKKRVSTLCQAVNQTKPCNLLFS